MTSQQDALYRAVCEYPDEDAPRLVFADCVEDAGDAARAALIRTQIALARVPEHDPLWAQCRRSHPNAIRGWALSYPLPRLPGGFTWHGHRMKRGFSWKAETADAASFSQSATALFAAAPIQALDFPHACGIKKRLPLVVEHPAFARLRRAEFSLTRLEEPDAQALGRSPFARLSELRLEDHAISVEGLHSLAESPLGERLAALELERAALPAALLLDALAALQSGELTKLELRQCGLTPAEVERLAALPGLQAIHSLDLSVNHLGADGVAAIAQGKWNHLEALKLHYTLPGVPGIKALVESSGFASLRWLDLSSNNLGPASVRLLADSRFMQSLRHLDLSGNRLGADAALLLKRRAGPELLELIVD